MPKNTKAKPFDLDEMITTMETMGVIGAVSHSIDNLIDQLNEVGAPGRSDLLKARKALGKEWDRLDRVRFNLKLAYGATDEVPKSEIVRVKH